MEKQGQAPERKSGSSIHSPLCRQAFDCSLRSFLFLWLHRQTAIVVLCFFSLCLCRLLSFLGQSSCNAWTSSIRDCALLASDWITSIPFVAHRQDTQPLPVIRVALSFLSSRAVHTIDQGIFLRLDPISLQLSLSSSNLGRAYRHFQPLNEF